MLAKNNVMSVLAAIWLLPYVVTSKTAAIHFRWQQIHVTFWAARYFGIHAPQPGIRKAFAFRQKPSFMMLTGVYKKAIATPLIIYTHADLCVGTGLYYIELCILRSLIIMCLCFCDEHTHYSKLSACRLHGTRCLCVRYDLIIVK